MQFTVGESCRNSWGQVWLSAGFGSNLETNGERGQARASILSAGRFHVQRAELPSSNALQEEQPQVSAS